jgi:elongation factor G
LQGYHNRLKSHTAGEGAYTMEFSHYEAVPPRIQQDLVGEFQKRKSADTE